MSPDAKPLAPHAVSGFLFGFNDAATEGLADVVAEGLAEAVVGVAEGLEVVEGFVWMATVELTVAQPVTDVANAAHHAVAATNVRKCLAFLSSRCEPMSIPQ